MMKNINEDSKDFEEGDTSMNSPALDMSFLKRVEKDINPKALTVFSKVFGIHSIAASVSLLICPQFGLQIFRHQPDLNEIFSVFGELGCHLACGFTFMAGSLLAASLLLSKDEVRKIRQHRIPMLGILSLISLAFFAIMSPSMIYQSIALVWITGAMVSSSLFLELGWKLR